MDLMLRSHSHRLPENTLVCSFEPAPNRALFPLLWSILALYLLGRLCQPFAPVLPTLLIVLLHVVPPALFALVHGTHLYRFRGFAVFTACCLITAAVFEILSLRTGFPFGQYVFTSVMGPKVLGLPILLVLAYLGIGYTSWILASLILRTRRLSRQTTWLFLQPAIAACIMTAWDVTMDPGWATLDHAWIWRNGGPWFGVPISNYFGWLLTTFAFYLLFALWLHNRAFEPAPQPRGFWRSATALYAICALGNLLIPFQPMAPPIVADHAGKLWQTSHILLACVLCSLFVMFPFAVFAWFRIPLRSVPNSQS